MRPIRSDYLESNWRLWPKCKALIYHIVVKDKEEGIDLKFEPISKHKMVHDNTRQQSA